MAFESSSQMSVVIVIKILLAIFLLLISVFGLVAYNRFKEFHILLPKFDDGELLGYVIISGFIGAIMEAYGSVVCYLQCNYRLRPVIRPCIDVLVVWDVAMSLKFVSSAVILFYCHLDSGYMFRVGSFLCIHKIGRWCMIFSKDGFFGAMSKYRTDEKIRSLLNVIHVTYGCCGNYNYSEWYKVNWKTSMSQHVVGFPESCCNKMAAQMLNDMCVAEIPYQVSYYDCLNFHNFYFVWQLILNE